jgi:hypothetical protein
MKRVMNTKTILIKLGRLIKTVGFVSLLVGGFGGCQKEIPQGKVLFDFESGGDLDRIHWKCHTLFSLSKEHATHGSKSLRMELYPSAYPGVTPILKDNDWSRFRALAFDVYNPEENEIKLRVRIDDKKEYPEYEDRYNRSFVLRKGGNRIEIPIESLVTSGTKRRLDARTIYKVIIFLVNPPGKRVLYLDYIRLVR